MMNKFRKMQARLKEEGWYVGWNEPCCQSCAWGSLPDYFDAKYNAKGYLVHPETGKELDYTTRDGVYKEIDLNKVLFNHSQDCEIERDYVDCEECDGEGGRAHESGFHECPKCEGIGGYTLDPDLPEGEDLIDTSVDGFICATPEYQFSSLFCHGGDKKSMKLLEEILPIIEECGVEVTYFDKTGKTRIELCWE